MIKIDFPKKISLQDLKKQEKQKEKDQKILMKEIATDMSSIDMTISEK
jgi:hypothetical protein